jgi:23S rRNA (pseudouridine1915-N3)-methyltransferase
LFLFLYTLSSALYSCFVPLSLHDSLPIFDPDGELLDSETFADLLGRGSDATSRLSFVIGGADGLGDGILAAADRRLAFGRLTWPHQMVRILLAEQLYRAMTILSGHPYHRS